MEEVARVPSSLRHSQINTKNKEIHIFLSILYLSAFPLDQWMLLLPCYHKHLS